MLCFYYLTVLHKFYCYKNHKKVFFVKQVILPYDSKRDNLILTLILGASDSVATSKIFLGR